MLLKKGQATHTIYTDLVYGNGLMTLLDFLNLYIEQNNIYILFLSHVRIARIPVIGTFCTY
jgi:hypothetical protein